MINTLSRFQGSDREIMEEQVHFTLFQRHEYAISVSNQYPYQLVSI